MPWSHTSPMDQNTQFIADYLRESLSITELCGMYGVTRKTGYKWIDRYLRQGPAGLEERWRRPQRSPNQTSEEIVAARSCWPCCTGAIRGGISRGARPPATF